MRLLVIMIPCLCVGHQFMLSSCLFLSRPLHARDHEEDQEQQETHDQEQQGTHDGSVETEVPIEVKK
jgi:hypothetical protein